MEETDTSDGTPDKCFDEEHTLPILQKIDELSNKIQVMFSSMKT